MLEGIVRFYTASARCSRAACQCRQRLLPLAMTGFARTHGQRRSLVCVYWMAAFRQSGQKNASRPTKVSVWVKMAHKPRMVSAAAS